jgi:hypothetical protein
LFVTYLLLLGCTPLVVLGAAVAALFGAGWPLAAAALLLGSRAALARTLRASYGLPAGWLRSTGALLVGESLIVAGALVALRSFGVNWRGHQFRVERGGVLRADRTD